MRRLCDGLELPSEQNLDLCDIRIGTAAPRRHMHEYMKLKRRDENMASLSRKFHSNKSIKAGARFVVGTSRILLRRLASPYLHRQDGSDRQLASIRQPTNPSSKFTPDSNTRRMSERLIA